MPPTIPASTPENNGAPDASATPRHKGRATENTIKPAVRSRGRVADVGPFGGGMMDNAPCTKPTKFQGSALRAATRCITLTSSTTATGIREQAAITPQSETVPRAGTTGHQ